MTIVDLGVIWKQWQSTHAPSEDIEQERLLDAARAEFIAHGFRRAAVADIARRANISRQTLNRRCGDKDDMISAVVTRETVQFFREIARSIDESAPIEDQVVETFVAGMRACRTNPVFQAIKEYESDTLSTRLTDTRHSSYQMVTAGLASRLAAASLPVSGAEQAAELLIRITATLLLAPTSVLATETDEQSRALARTYFIPILNAARAQQ